MTPRSCLVFLSLLAMAACGGSQRDGTSASRGSEAPQEKAREQHPAQQLDSGGALPEVGSETSPRPKAISSRPILDLLPQDRSIVVHLSWRLIQASAAFQQNREAVTKSVQPYVAFVTNACGLDPVDEIESVTMAIGSDPQSKDDSIIALTLRIGRSEVEDCIRKAGGTVEEGKYLVRGNSFHVHWADQSTLLVAQKMSAKEMQSALAMGRATSSESLMEFLRKSDSHAAIWGGGVLPASMSGTQPGTSVAMPRGLHFSVNVRGALDAAMELSFLSKEDANTTLRTLQALKQMMSSQPAWATMSTAMQMQQVGNQITLNLVLSSQDLEKIIDASK